jgi:hypothetical protein
MSGWRQDQYLEQAYHAITLQPAQSAVASEGGLPPGIRLRRAMAGLITPSSPDSA